MVNFLIILFNKECNLDLWWNKSITKKTSLFLLRVNWDWAQFTGSSIKLVHSSSQLTTTPWPILAIKNRSKQFGINYKTTKLGCENYDLCQLPLKATGILTSPSLVALANIHLNRGAIYSSHTSYIKISCNFRLITFVCVGKNVLKVVFSFIIYLINLHKYSLLT